MKDPTLKFQKYDSQKRETIDVCELRLQYFAPDSITDLWDYEVDHKGDWKRAFKCGEINSREHTNKILFGVNGYIYSFAKVFAKSGHHEHDHLIATFSGYGDCTGMTVILDLAQYMKLFEQPQKPIIDDYDLLMQKYEAICNT